ncbi:MAG: molecular chaperone HscC [Lawsonibacter sp.]|nr:molecular chaperone HscC [Lawsonibacter sp.]
MAIIGIDLGTTNSLAAVWRNGRSELIPNAAGAFLTPSAVSLDEDGTVLVGQAARDRLISHPERTAARFKRYMGTDKVFHLGERSFTPEELSALVLRSLREDAEAYLGEPVTEAVISVPAYFAEPQRSATKRAGALAGLRVERLVNEPSAAAVAAHIAEGDQDKVCLVFDLGGGTLDVSLVERFENVVSVTAVSGDNRLGGTDFDLAIAKAFCQETGMEFDALETQQRELLIRQAESCKIALTTQEPVLMTVDNDGKTASLLLTNEWMIHACSTLFQRLAAPARRVFVDAGMSIEELDELVLVGGSSHMPSVRRYIARLLGRKPSEDSRPDTAIALGVGICAGIKARAADLKELVLTDVCPFTLGVAVLDRSSPGRPLMSPLIERNCVLPSSREDVYTTAYDNQDTVNIRVYQGENLHCDDNTFLGSLMVKVPKDKQGHQPVRVRFTYDINGLLEVEAANAAGKMSRLVVKNNSMSDAEAERRLVELSALKLHPREQEVPRALIAQAERLYVASVGQLRGQVVRLLEWYQNILNSQNPLLIGRASRHMKQTLGQLETWMGECGLPELDFSLFDEERDEDEEDTMS